jgi:hypothetical protein
MQQMIGSAIEAPADRASITQEYVPLHVTMIPLTKKTKQELLTLTVFLDAKQAEGAAAAASTNGITDSMHRMHHLQCLPPMAAPIKACLGSITVT